jgi:hypothetical protein
MNDIPKNISTNNPQLSVKQLRILSKLEKQPKRVAFLNFYHQFPSLAYASGLAGITKSQGNNLLVSLRVAGFDLPKALSKGHKTDTERINAAISISKSLYVDPDNLLSMRSGFLAPDYRTNAGKQLLIKALNDIGDATVKESRLIKRFTGTVLTNLFGASQGCSYA